MVRWLRLSGAEPVNRIPLPPVVDPQKPSRTFGAEAPRPKRRSIFDTFFRLVGWLGSSPVHWIGVKSIRQGASSSAIWRSGARARSARDPRFRTAEAGRFDLRATAFSMGLTVSDLEARFYWRGAGRLPSYPTPSRRSAPFPPAVWFLKVMSTPMAEGRFCWRSTSCRSACCLFSWPSTKP